MAAPAGRPAPPAGHPRWRGARRPTGQLGRAALAAGWPPLACRRPTGHQGQHDRQTQSCGGRRAARRPA
eukprot:1246401-Alexandrium_andersonii.AAC.1